MLFFLFLFLLSFLCVCVFFLANLENYIWEVLDLVDEVGSFFFFFSLL